MHFSQFYCWRLRDFSSAGMSLSPRVGGEERDGTAGLGCAGVDPPGQMGEVWGRWDLGCLGAEDSVRSGLGDIWGVCGVGLWVWSLQRAGLRTRTPGGSLEPATNALPRGFL